MTTDLEGAVERAAAILKAWNRRETDLLEANNRYLERARAAEAERDGYQKHLRACEQIAGKALGYPWFKDDQKNFPGTTEAEGVCIGDHVGDTIVEELATRFEAVTRERDAMREAGKPFFDLAKTVTTPASGSPPWWQESQDWTVVFSFAGCSVTLGDLRRAAALVNGEGGK